MRKALAAVLLIAAWLRLDGLGAWLPIVGDESIYLRWAEIALHQGSWFVSLLDGKQPLSVWLQALSWWLAPDDPLWAGRLVSTLAGVVATLGIFAVGRRVSGDAAGLAAAFLYAVCPYALLYDRLAHTDSLVNLAGVAVVYGSIAAFQSPEASWRRGVVLGLALGLGYFAKATALAFGLVPVAAAIMWGRGRSRRTVAALAIAFGVALVFPLLAKVATPRAPMMASASVIVHQTGFFPSFHEWMERPLAAAPANARLLAGYARAYLTLPLSLAGLAAAGYLLWRRSPAATLVLAASVAPLALQVLLLKLIFPSRYPFPHIWPWLLAVAVAAAELWDRYGNRRRVVAALLGAALAAPVVAAGVGVVRAPAAWLHPEDAQTFAGSGPAAGFGIREAAEFLRQQARSGPLVLLTDPIWGPPADSMFIYLNQRDGIRVYEAWWTTIAGNYPILPPVPVELVRSQYERVAAGWLDPRSLGRVFYVTERAYTSPEAVAARQPAARLLASFVKPNGRNAIDVYRLH